MNVGELKRRLMLSDPDTPFAVQVCFPSGKKNAPADPCSFGSEDVPPETATFMFEVDATLYGHADIWGSSVRKETNESIWNEKWRTRDELIPFLEALLERMK